MNNVSRSTILVATLTFLLATVRWARPPPNPSASDNGNTAGGSGGGTG
jgi:hypothetical protein